VLKLKTLSSFAAISVVAFSAHAKTLSDVATQGLVDLSQLNVIVTGNMSGGDDVEGKTFVGGNLANAATYGIGRGFIALPTTNRLAPSTSTYATLTVGGNAYGNININSGPNVSAPEGAVIGGNAGTVSINGSPASLTVGGSVGNFNANGDAYAYDVGPSVAAGIATQTQTFSTDLTELSKELAALPTDGSVTDTDPNNFTLTATPNALGFEIIDVTATELATASNIIYNFSSANPTIINVTGPAGYTFIDTANNNNGDAYASSVLWNFIGASSVNLQRQEEGGVLAPDATLSNNSPIEGSVAVANFNQGGEVHLGTFDGAIPEPATWWMIIVGAAFMGGVARSGRAARLHGTVA
jgi:choice-of-anchor A domain-containing protein